MPTPIPGRLTVFALALLMLAAVDGAGALEIPPDKAVISLQPKFGPVLFSHRRHASEMGIACQACHHTLQDAGRPQPCHDCHQAKAYRIAATRPADEPQRAQQPASEPLRAKLAFHGLCRGCHARRAAQQLASGPSDSCRDCHD